MRTADMGREQEVRLGPFFKDRAIGHDELVQDNGPPVISQVPAQVPGNTGLFSGLETLERNADFLVVDASAGLSSNVLAFAAAAKAAEIPSR